MPEFHITAPDGTIYNVSGPPGSTQDEALAQVQAMHAKESGGILKNFGAGAVSALTSLGPQMASTFSPLGNVADIVQFARGKGPAAATPLINQEMTRLPNKLAGPLNPDTVSRETLPEKLSFGAGAGVTGALIPGAEGYTVGNMLRNAVLGMTSGTGAVAGGEGAAALAPEPLKPAARTIGSLVGGVAAPVAAVGAVNGVRSAMTSGAPEAFPSINELNTAKKAAYDVVDNSTMKIGQPAVKTLYEGVKDALAKRGLNDDTVGGLAPMTATALKSLGKAGNSEQTLQEMEVQRRIAGIAAGAPTKTDRAAARLIQDHIDDFIQNLQPEHLTGALDENAINALPVARELAQRSFKAQTIQGLMDKAATNASLFQGSGLENSIRTQFRKLANNERGMSRFTPDEQLAIKKVATGGSPLSAANLFRYVGKFSPQGVIPAVAEAGAYAAAGPSALALPAAGIAGRMAATALTKRAAKDALSIVSRGKGTVGQNLRAAVEASTPGGEIPPPNATNFDQIKQPMVNP